MKRCETPDLAEKKMANCLALADNDFDVFVTIDRNIPFQQNLAGKRIAILIIRVASSDLNDIRPYIPQAIAALKSIKPQQIIEVGIAS